MLTVYEAGCRDKNLCLHGVFTPERHSNSPGGCYATTPLEFILLILPLGCRPSGVELQDVDSSGFVQSAHVHGFDIRCTPFMVRCCQRWRVTRIRNGDTTNGRWQTTSWCCRRIEVCCTSLRCPPLLLTSNQGSLARIPPRPRIETHQ